ncbi:hypothetical protein VS877_22610, partial [Salmonella enterica subsp. enterica serovar Paratyphi A]|nr:hypothetical protein [Salmonella enterica subsp. enterica serovar Paratyphi A]
MNNFIQQCSPPLLDDEPVARQIRTGLTTFDQNRSRRGLAMNNFIQQCSPPLLDDEPVARQIRTGL